MNARSLLALAPLLAACGADTSLDLGDVTAVEDPLRAGLPTCGSFRADDGDNIIVLGEATSTFNSPSGPVTFGTGRLAACWRDASGRARFDQIGTCGTSTVAGTFAQIEALRGSDRLTLNARARTCIAGQPSTVLWPFPSYFRFGVHADMGPGADQAWGTPNRDVLSSAVSAASTPSAAADGAADLLCGLGGDDDLFGDSDETASTAECLDGGSGVDYCTGIGWSSPEQDRHLACETAVRSAGATCGGYPFTCHPCLFRCGTSAPDLWPW